MAEGLAVASCRAWRTALFPWAVNSQAVSLTRFDANQRSTPFTAVAMRIIRTPVRAPRANAIAERWIASAPRECLDRMLITGERHVRLVLSEYVDHDNGHRPHRTLHTKRARGEGSSFDGSDRYAHPAPRPARGPDPRIRPGRLR
jgi:putative transposase